MELKGLVANQTAAGLALAKLLFDEESSNIVFSPLSIHVVLSMIAAGSNGPTRDQLLAFLHAESTGDLDSLFLDGVASIVSEGNPSSRSCQPFREGEEYWPPPKLTIANGLWVEKSIPLRDSFKQLVNHVYKACASQVDLVNKPRKVETEVNRWAEDKTDGLIDQILPRGSLERDPRPVLILANALHFKAAWADDFTDCSTKDDDFFLLNNSKVRVPFMRSGCARPIGIFDGFKVLKLHYAGGDSKPNSWFSMNIFLPDATDGLPALAKRLYSEPEFLERHIPRQCVEVGTLRIPKFTISFQFEASEMLQEMGLKLPFRQTGGLLGMLDLPSRDAHLLNVSRIFHKSFVKIDERGTEAVAVTAEDEDMGCSLHWEPPPTVDFIADHPFLFVIREGRTGIVLFIGRVMNPLLE